MNLYKYLVKKKWIRTDRAAFWGLIGFLIVVVSDLFINNEIWDKVSLFLAFLAIVLCLYFAEKDRKYEDEKLTMIIGASSIILILLIVIYMVFRFDIL